MQIYQNHVMQIYQNHVMQIYQNHVMQIYQNHVMQIYQNHVMQIYQNHVMQIYENHVMQMFMLFMFICHIANREAPLNPRPTGGGGLFRAPPLVFLQYLLNQCMYHHQTCSTLSPNNFTHCVKILKSRVL